MAIYRAWIPRELRHRALARAPKPQALAPPSTRTLKLESPNTWALLAPQLNRSWTVERLPTLRHLTGRSSIKARAPECYNTQVSACGGALSWLLVVHDSPSELWPSYNEMNTTLVGARVAKASCLPFDWWTHREALCSSHPLTTSFRHPGGGGQQEGDHCRQRRVVRMLQWWLKVWLKYALLIHLHSSVALLAIHLCTLGL